MMNYKSLLSLLTSVLILNACSKDSSENKPTPPEDKVLEQYSTSNTMTIDQLALVTKNGVETNIGTITAWADKHITNPAYRVLFQTNGAKTVADHGINIQFNLLEKDQVLWNGEKMDIVNRQDDLMWVVERDSTAMPSEDNTTCGTLLDKVPGFLPWSQCATNNYTRYKNKYPVSIAAGDYYLPVIYYAVGTWYPDVVNGAQVYKYCDAVPPTSPSINLLNTNLQSSLNDKDTVLVQIGRVQLAKKS